MEVDAELVERASRAGAPTGRGAGAVVEDALRAFLGAEVIDTVRPAAAASTRRRSPLLVTPS